MTSATSAFTKVKHVGMGALALLTGGVGNITVLGGDIVGAIPVAHVLGAHAVATGHVAKAGGDILAGNGQKVAHTLAEGAAHSSVTAIGGGIAFAAPFADTALKITGQEGVYQHFANVVVGDPNHSHVKPMDTPKVTKPTEIANVPVKKNTVGGPV